MMEKFDVDVGLKYLRGMHLNDSKTECGSNKDRHENIGLGHLKLQTFRHILSDPRVQDIPLVLETPCHEENTGSWDVWKKEIEILNRMSPGHVAGKDDLPNMHDVEGSASSETIPDHDMSSRSDPDPGSSRSDSDVLEIWTKEIQQTVDGAVSLAKRKAKKTQNKRKLAKKKKGDSEDDEIEVDEDDG
ncbi:DNA-(apurinic or apyrimidinic site) lyase [Marasmius crinis-equi]|uniref:DNA-(Apurinic or apyrimidinic site) lyase n=1 Tax=Marasmius crinis-equi TaxID=585013 RepID=A0ABR3EV21_9AGAR